MTTRRNSVDELTVSTVDKHVEQNGDLHIDVQVEGYFQDANGSVVLKQPVIKTVVVKSPIQSRPSPINDPRQQGPI